MRFLLADIAGRYYMEGGAPEAERVAFRGLESCEDLVLAARPRLTLARTPPEPFPTLADEQRRLEAVRPGWLGMRYRAPKAGERRRDDLPTGAAIVLAAGITVPRIWRSYAWARWANESWLVTRNRFSDGMLDS